MPILILTHTTKNCFFLHCVYNLQLHLQLHLQGHLQGHLQMQYQM